MEVIPVIDLKGGLVVRARHGDRAILSPDRDAAQPDQRARSTWSPAFFRCIRSAPSMSPTSTRSKVAATRSAIIDADRRTIPAPRALARQWLRRARSAREDFLRRFPRASLVLGSESQRDSYARRGAPQRPTHRSSRSIFAATNFSARQNSCATQSLWPARLILMTLARVGSGAGPDFDRLATIKDAKPPTARSTWREGCGAATISPPSKQAARPASSLRPHSTTAGLPPADLAATRSASCRMRRKTEGSSGEPGAPSSQIVSARPQKPSTFASRRRRPCCSTAGAFPWGLPPI